MKIFLKSLFFLFLGGAYLPFSLSHANKNESIPFVPGNGFSDPRQNIASRIIFVELQVRHPTIILSMYSPTLTETQQKTIQRNNLAHIEVTKKVVQKSISEIKDKNYISAEIMARIFPNAMANPPGYGVVIKTVTRNLNRLIANPQFFQLSMFPVTPFTRSIVNPEIRINRQPTNKWLTPFAVWLSPTWKSIGLFQSKKNARGEIYISSIFSHANIANLANGTYWFYLTLSIETPNFISSQTREGRTYLIRSLEAFLQQISNQLSRPNRVAQQNTSTLQRNRKMIEAWLDALRRESE